MTRRRLVAVTFVLVLLVSSAAGAAGARPGPVDGDAGIGDPYTPGQGNGGYDVRRYDLELRIDPERRVVQGTASIELVPTAPLRSFTFDLSGFTVEVVEVDGVAARVGREYRKLRVTPAQPLAKGGPVVVRVRYRGHSETANRTGWLWFGDGGTLLLTQTNGASTLFPSNDHPSDKATFAFDLTTPRGTVGVANGLLDRRSTDDNGTGRFEWSKSEPFPTYAAVVAVGRFRLVRETGRGGLRVVNAVPEERAGKLALRLRRQDEIVPVLERYF